jgi:hypothetical protein
MTRHVVSDDLGIDIHGGQRQTKHGVHAPVFRCGAPVFRCGAPVFRCMWLHLSVISAVAHHERFTFVVKSHHDDSRCVDVDHASTSSPAHIFSCRDASVINLESCRYV